MKNILVFMDYYLPGYKAGGPITTVSNMVNRLHSLKFNIITRNHDQNDSTYKTIESDSWNKVGMSEVYYLSEHNLNFKYLTSLISRTEVDVYYFNSFFSIKFTLYPLLLLKFKKIPQKPIILAPRGEFFQNALNIKKWVKKIYLIVFKILHLTNGIIWQASTEMEENAIRNKFGKNINVKVARDLIYIPPRKIQSIVGNKEPGNLNIIFLSRIAPIKNLDYALNLLHSVRGNVKFEIYGPIEDKGYWETCKGIIDTLPKNVTVEYRGVYDKNDGVNIFETNHVFLLPTKGENFGHVIFEALSAGCPVVISDETPWRNLEEKTIGWDISLAQPERFIEVLNRLIMMSEKELGVISINAVNFTQKIAEDETEIKNNETLFNIALN